MNRLRTLSIEGFRSIRDQRVEFGDINVLIGANGAGKSNLLGAIQLLSFIGTEGLGAFVGRGGGASELLYMGPKRTPVMRFRADFGVSGGTAAYRASLAHAAGDALIFTHEEVGYCAEGSQDFRWVGLGSGHSESKLALAARDGDLTAKTVRWSLQHIARYHFHDTGSESRIRNRGQVDDNRYLRSDAGNLAAWLYALERSHPERFARVEGTIRQIAPYFGGFALERSRLNPDFIMLEWKERTSGHIFRPGALSDGTLRSMALVAMLLQPPEDTPWLTAIDEPELGLHPFAMGVISALVRAASCDSQFVLSTQSTRLLDCFEVADVIVVDRQEGASVFKRLDPNELEGWLGEYTVSELWEKNVIGGGPGL